MAALLAAGIGCEAESRKKNRRSERQPAAPTSVTSAEIAPERPHEPPEAPQPVLDVPSIVGRSQNDVEAILGRPTSCETVNPSRVGKVPKCTYVGGNVEVVFIGGKADWITVYGSKAPASSEKHLDGRATADALPQLGLPVVSGTAGPMSVMFSHAFPGLRSVMLSKTAIDDDRLTYAYIKAMTD